MLCRRDDLSLEDLAGGSLGQRVRAKGPWKTHWCAILTFADGRGLTERAYFDIAAWPGAAEALGSFRR